MEDEDETVIDDGGWESVTENEKLLLLTTTIPIPWFSWGLPITL